MDAQHPRDRVEYTLDVLREAIDRARAGQDTVLVFATPDERNDARAYLEARVPEHPRARITVLDLTQAFAYGRERVLGNVEFDQGALRTLAARWLQGDS